MSLESPLGLSCADETENLFIVALVSSSLEELEGGDKVNLNVSSESKEYYVPVSIPYWTMIFPLWYGPKLLVTPGGVSLQWGRWRSIQVCLRIGLILHVLIWRFPKSWGYPQSSSISRWDFPWNKPSIFGYPHRNGTPHLARTNSYKSLGSMTGHFP